MGPEPISRLSGGEVVARMRLKDVPAPLEVRYHGAKLHHVITFNVINIAKHIEATKIASRLNIRSRL
jgi:hypothetical protein